MHKITIAIFICLSTNTIQSQTKVQELSIGDKMPDIAIGKAINFEKSNLRTSDFKGKSLILDFWAPWCSPCIATWPKLDSLQKKFNTQLLILPVTKESQQFASKVLQNIKKVNKISLLHSIVEDSTFSRLFRHSIVPHYVWINSEGIISAITDVDYLTETNVLRFINKDKLNLPVKEDKQLNLDYNKPIFLNNDLLNPDEVVYNSKITKYIQGVTTVSSQNKNLILCTNHPIQLLYKIAYGKFNIGFLNDSRLILEGFNSQDSLMIGRYTSKNENSWNEIRYSNLYNYELTFSDSTFSFEEKFKIMQEDLNRFFASKKITGRLEKRNVKVLSLTKTTTKTKFKSNNSARLENEFSKYYISMHNKPISFFLMKLQSLQNGNSKLLQDETDIRENIDIEIEGDLSDINVINKELSKYGLQFIERERLLDMIVISKTH